MIQCENLPLLHALADNELDAANNLTVETHVKGCADCASKLREITALSARVATAGVRYTAPQELRDRLDRMIVAQTAEARPVWKSRSPDHWRWLTGGALAGIAASLALLIAVPQVGSGAVEDQYVSSHVRSLMGNHLTDITTSNQHAIKPWFNGRINFAPPVVDLADAGFPLAGGRLDYVEGHVVPALVYRRHLHTINLFVQPSPALPLRGSIDTRRDGYNLIRWNQGGFEYWAVSDLNPVELRLFRRRFDDRVGR